MSLERRPSVRVPRGGSLRGRSVLSAQATALATQAFGALQLLLLIRYGASRATDGYFVLYAAGQLVVAVWVLGVIYPRHLADSQLSWRGRAPVAGAVAGGCTLLAGGYLVTVGYSLWALLPLLVLLTVVAITSAIASCFAVALACGGRPRPLAGITLAPNVCACVALLIPLSRIQPVLRMSVGLAIGSVALLPLFGRAVRSMSSARPTAPHPTSPQPQGIRWLAYGAVIGNVAPVALQAALATLPGGQLTAFSVASRIALAATSVGLNSVLPLLVSWDRYDEPAIRQLSRIALVLAPVTAGTAAVVAATAVRPGPFGTAVVVLFVIWALVAPTTTLATQATVRRGDFSAFRLSGTFNVLATSLGIAFTVASSSLEAAVATMLVVQTGASAILMHRLGWVRELQLLGAVAACAVAPALDVRLVVVPVIFTLFVAVRLLNRPQLREG